MTDAELLEAQQQRDESILEYDIAQIIERRFSASDVIGQEARTSLMGVLKFYAQNPHPYRACVADNMAKFGPGKTERICGTLKDMIRATTRWHNFSDADTDSSSYTPTDTERAEIMASLTDEDWAALQEVVHDASSQAR